MSRIEWDESISVGVDWIDVQHKTWISYLNDMSEAVAARQSAVQVVRTLGFLIDYTEFHFATEEKHMQSSGYPGLEEHKAKHDKLRETLARLVEDYGEDGPTRNLAEDLDTFLGNWLKNHIRDIDQGFGAFLKAEGIVITDAIQP